MPSISSPTPDATTASKGKVQLAGVLSGTAASPALRLARQNDTTNTSITGARIETGWGSMVITAGTATYTETVTFGTAFTTAPIIVVCPAGDAVTATGNAYGNGTNAIAATWNAKMLSPTTSSFSIKMDTGAVGANGFVFYTWTAIGS